MNSSVKQSVDYILKFMLQGAAESLSLNKEHLMEKGQLPATDVDVRVYIRELVANEKQQLEIANLKKMNQKLQQNPYSRLIMDKKEQSISQGEEEAKRLIQKSSHARYVVILIENHSSNYTLCNPQYFIASGAIEKLEHKISPGGFGLASFAKSGFLRGTWGVLSYQLDNTQKRIAIMWSVPYDQKVINSLYKSNKYKRVTKMNVVFR